jgi:two-component system sensor histidine kinase MtrB
VANPGRALRSIWSRNLQLRLVSVTLLLSAIILGLVGAVLVNRVTAGLLKAKESSSLTEATAARDEVQRLLIASDTGAVPTTQMVDAVITALAVRSGSPGLFDALFLSGPTLVGEPERGTKLVSETSVPDQLRSAVQTSTRQAWQYTTIIYEDGATAPGIVVGAPVSVPRIGQYELYLLFPMSAEQESIGLLHRAVLATGLALMVLLGIVVWFMTAQVTEPVRETALVAQALASGELGRRLTVRGSDDLATLAAAFNDMATSLQQQIERLETLSSVQQQFVSDVSHELRTPLTTVRMAAEMVYGARTALDSGTARSAELLMAQVERFDELLSDLLEISRFDAGVAAAERTTVDVAALVCAVVAEFDEIARAHGTHISLAGTESPLVIEADGRRLARIVRNLVANGVEHSERRPVEVSLAATQDAVSVGVRDYGHGIAPENWESVFSRFWRADPARQRTLGGTGLGLAIAAEDAALHGGIIEVWGEVAAGAHFVLTVPRDENRPFTVPAIEVIRE